MFTNRLPYAFLNREGRLTGLDVELAHQLAKDLGVALDFVRLAEGADLPRLLSEGRIDLVMIGAPVTPERASQMLFSQPYLDETLAFVVKDHLREDFSSWSRIRQLGAFRVTAPDVPYYVTAIRERAPSLQVESTSDMQAIEDGLEHGTSDAMVLPAERGSVMTLLYPQVLGRRAR